jgi:hypothetical protein
MIFKQVQAFNLKLDRSEIGTGWPSSLDEKCEKVGFTSVQQNKTTFGYADYGLESNRNFISLDMWSRSP